MHERNPRPPKQNLPPKNRDSIIWNVIVILIFLFGIALLGIPGKKDGHTYSVPTGNTLGIPGDKYSSYPYLPNKLLTPGDVMSGITKEHVCTSGYSASARNVSNSTKRQIFDSYGISGEYGSYEIDHLISLQLGGSNSWKNLWPQPYKLSDWHARKKDGLENRLHSLVCKGIISLEEAQRAISENWIEAYKKYMADKMENK